MTPQPPEITPADRQSALRQARAPRFKEMIQRVAVVLLNLSAIALLWWSLQKGLLPLQQKTRDTNLTVTRLISEVDRMEHVWPQAEIEQVRSKFGGVRSWMFVGRPAVESWLSEVKERVVPLALDVEPNFTKPEPAEPVAITNAASAISPMTLALKIHPAPGIEAIATPFQRTLQFSQRLTAQEKRVDLVELTAIGGLNSVERAVVVLHLWTGEESDLQ